ncbi:hypothetical protein ATO6_15165 [Oceanicola sp. 22II-s10i]|uniref:acyl-CoA dehydrogenase family protein n=1 Tax=Oceanicola sp. 22II-s10i TaxID=1317116 RepID=UPI000B525649|nr:acyl-CoA dehydrogenase [Oceanicola sp. 22II-s10i]OWU83780.1 hypothetical protein ATO6_15165 [Oceanicola sp. 22II-s10i]
MHFDITDEQRMITDSVARLLQDDTPGDAETWASIREMGAVAMAFPEESGGIGSPYEDMVFALTEFGKAGSDAAFIANAMLPGAMVRGARVADEDMLTALSEGRARAAVAIAGKASVLPELVDGRVSGRWSGVVGGADADVIFLSVRNGDTVEFHVVSRDAPGLKVEASDLIDGRGAAVVTVDGLALSDETRVDLGNVDGAERLELLNDVGAFAMGADALGAIETIRDMTLDYLKTRKQFGVAIGSFQVLQHAMVDLAHEAEQFRSIVYRAACALDGVDADARRLAVSSLKRQVNTRLRPAGMSAIQMHGGIGVTEEYALGRLVKRLLVADMLFGSADDHARRLRDLFADGKALV